MPARLDDGINFFNSQRYFEAHETWEEMWREEQGELRLFYQGLVQAAVGLHHLSRGNLLGFRSQLAKSLAKLDQYRQETAGLDVEKFRHDLAHLLDDPEAERPRIDAIR